MGIKYLWDTNTAIYYLQQQFPVSAEKFVDSILVNSKPAISVITEIELMCWKGSSEKDNAVIKSFITDCFLFELEQSIKEQTAVIRKEVKMKLPDAIIAATALSYNLTLVTRNVADFKNLPTIKLVNPFEQ